MNQELEDEIYAELALEASIMAKHIAKLSCTDGLCGASDCNKCNPGWYRREEKEDD
jgi:hypothetical protein